jgi:putative transposase
METPDGRTIPFCTVCTKDRRSWLTNADVAPALERIWRTEARAWIVGRWLLMPNHAHFFCTPSVGGKHSGEDWTQFWKERLTRTLSLPPGQWQRGVFHHRIRSAEEYLEKLSYVSLNPVRAGLVNESAQWPWQGEIERIAFDR